SPTASRPSPRTFATRSSGRTRPACTASRRRSAPEPRSANVAMTVFMEARVNVRPLTNATMDRFVDHYSDVEHPILERNGYDLVGAWKATGGPLGQVIHLYRFDTISALDLSRTSLLGDPDLLTIYQSAMSVLDGAAMREL